MPRDFTIKQAIDRYLRERESEVSESTLYNHTSALRRFKSFCDEEGVDSISDVDAFVISDFRLQREDEDLSPNTIYNNLSSIRTFVGWCEDRNLISEGLKDSIMLPDADRVSKDEHITPERAEEILDYLSTYEYASLPHALFILLWDTGIRLGAARSLDVDDFKPDEMYVLISHDPEEDTPLKNGTAAEREVNLSTTTATILEDYINGKRTQATDDYEREPLFSTRNGRIHRNTLRKRIVSLTRPCYYSNECPHDRVIEECEANSYDTASSCPSSISPHPIRQSSITHWLDKGYSKELLSDRMDVSVEVLEKHYDARSEEQKRKLRREMLDID